MKESIVVIGIGQCGSNLAYEFHQKGYTTFYINTSESDLDSIKVNNRFKYHIPASKGCAKDQTLALSYAKDYYGNMMNIIDHNFPFHNHIMFTCSAAGGTGSLIAPVLLEMMIRKNPTKNYMLAMAMPSVYEPVKPIRNALVTYKRVIKIIGSGNIYILDNNNLDNKFDINKIFANRFDSMISITEADSRGIIDEEELQTMLKCGNNAVIDEFDINSETYIASIFMSYERGCKYLAYSTIREVNPNMFTQRFGVPEDRFYGFNDHKNIIMATGLPFSNSRIEQYISVIKSKEYIQSQAPKVIDYEIPFIKVREMEVKQSVQQTKFDDILTKYM